MLYKRIVMRPWQREKPRYLLLNSIVCSLASLETSLIVSPELTPEIEGDDSGAAEGLLVLRSPTESAKERALGVRSLTGALKDGCQASALVAVVAVIDFDSIWRPLAAALQLAVSNHTIAKQCRELAHSVSVILTDATRWFFFSVQLLEPPPSPPPVQPPQAPCVEGQGLPGLRFTAMGRQFRLFDCHDAVCDVLRPAGESDGALVQLLTCLYHTLHPGLDINHLDQQLRDAEQALHAEVSAWRPPVRARPEKAEIEKVDAAAAAQVHVAAMPAAVAAPAAPAAAAEQAGSVIPEGAPMCMQRAAAAAQQAAAAALQAAAATQQQVEDMRRQLLIVRQQQQQQAQQAQQQQQQLHAQPQQQQNTQPLPPPPPQETHQQKQQPQRTQPPPPPSPQRQQPQPQQRTQPPPPPPQEQPPQPPQRQQPQPKVE